MRVVGALERFNGRLSSAEPSVNCVTKLPLGSFFHALLALAHGGTLSGASSSPVFQPGQFSAGFGVWRQTGRRTYSALSDAFILFSGGPFPAGRQEIRHSIHVSDDGNRFTDDASINYFDVNDLPAPPQAPLIPGCASRMCWPNRSVLDSCR